MRVLVCEATPRVLKKLLKAGTVRRDQTPPRYYGRLELALKACDTAPP